MKKLLTILVTAILALTAVFGIMGCNKDVDDVAYIKEKGTLVVGVTVYPPMDWVDEDSGEWTGFDADIANKLGEKLGVTVQFVIIKWANKVAELNSKNIDCIWNGMTASSDLDENIDFSCSYAENRQVAVVLTENASSYTTLDAIKNAKIAVEQGSAGDIQATETVKATTINKVKDQVTALTEVASGQSQVALIDLTMANSVVGKGSYANLSIVDPDVISFGQEEFAVGVRTGSNLADEINALFKTLYNDGTMLALANAYSGIVLNNAKLGAL